MFRDDFWGLGDPWGALGRFLGPFGPKSVFRTGKHGSLDPLWAPLADPKIDRKSLKFIHVDLFFEKNVSQNRSTSKTTFYPSCVQFWWPRNLVFWALACTGARFSKNGLITKSCKKTSQSTTKWKPQASILSPRVKQLPFVGKQNAVRKIAPKKSPKKSREPCKSCKSGMGGSLKFN